MIGVIANVDFAPIRNGHVTVGKTLFAKTNRTHRHFTATERIRRFAYGTACPAIPGAVAEFYLATVQQTLVAIGKSRRT
jgi:hypothetical protein